MWKYFFLLQDKLDIDIVGVDCAGLVHNAIAVRTIELKNFCDEVEVVYENLIGYINTRWLALPPAIERVLKMFPGPNSYSLSSVDK